MSNVLPFAFGESTRRRFLYQLGAFMAASNIFHSGWASAAIRRRAIPTDISVALWFRRPKVGTYMGWAIDVEPIGGPVDLGADEKPFPDRGPERWRVTIGRDEPGAELTVLEATASTADAAEALAVAWIEDASARSTQVE